METPQGTAPETNTPQPPQQPELHGMPEKTLATKLAEEILTLKEHIKDKRDEQKVLKQRFINEMRVKQQSRLVVKGFEFEVELEDVVTITKKKNTI